METKLTNKKSIILVEDSLDKSQTIPEFDTKEEQLALSTNENLINTTELFIDDSSKSVLANETLSIQDEQVQLEQQDTISETSVESTLVEQPEEPQSLSHLETKLTNKKSIILVEDSLDKSFISNLKYNNEINLISSITF